MFGSDPQRGRRKPAPSGLTVQEAADSIGVAPELLRQFIREGALPSPLYVNGWPEFSRDYVVCVQVAGVCLPGTYAVSPTRWFRTKSAVPPHERTADTAVPQPKRHILHGKPGPKPKGGAR